MRTKHAALLGSAVAAWLTAACNAHRGSGATDELSASPQSQTNEHDEPPAGATPEDAVEAMAKRRARAMLPDGPMLRAELRQGGHRDQLLVLRGGNCYRVLAAGDEGIEDLDLFLFDPNGVLTQQDPAQDRYPTLGVQSELCPPVSGAYRLQASAYKGSGTYALRVYRTP
ncbi:MAG: hypothetical protein ACHQ53_06115 [Polyangiales bacterium]